MKLEIIIFGITAFFIANAYYDNKYVNMLKSYKKYYQMTFFGFLGLSLYLFIRKHPGHSKSMLAHANGIIKYMPIDKSSADLLTPLLDFSSKSLDNGTEFGMSSQQKRMMNSGGDCGSYEQRGGNSKGTKRSVSETKKKYVAAQQNWNCLGCQTQLPGWFEVDHRVRLDQGGSNHISNLVALCPNCHRKKTAMENL